MPFKIIYEDGLFRWFYGCFNCIPSFTPAPTPILNIFTFLITLRLLGSPSVGTDAPTFYPFSSLSYFLQVFQVLNTSTPLAWWQVCPVPIDSYTSSGTKSTVQPLSRSVWHLIKTAYEYHLEAYSTEASGLLLSSSRFLRSLDLEKMEQVCRVNEAHCVHRSITKPLPATLGLPFTSP